MTARPNSSSAVDERFRTSLLTVWDAATAQLVSHRMVAGCHMLASSRCSACFSYACVRASVSILDIVAGLGHYQCQQSHCRGLA